MLAAIKTVDEIIRREISHDAGSLVDFAIDSGYCKIKKTNLKFTKVSPCLS